jgi:hypothetical protein
VHFGTFRPSMVRVFGAVSSLVMLVGMFGISLLAGQGATASAASPLPYHRGYYVTSGWMCYGWSSGTWHCTHHWHRAANGALVSENTRWVPNGLGGGAQVAAIAQASAAKLAPARQAPVTQSAPARQAPAPAAPAATVGQQGVINEIRAVFGSHADQAIRVARCESGFSPTAVDPISVAGSHAEGVFQILYPGTWRGTSYAGSSPFDASANIHAAYQIFARDGYSWREWECKP